MKKKKNSFEEIKKFTKPTKIEKWKDFHKDNRTAAWLKYRWEFMRRDPEYQKAYEELRKYKTFATQIQYERSLNEFSEHFGVRATKCTLNPSLSFEEHLVNISNGLFEMGQAKKEIPNNREWRDFVFNVALETIGVALGMETQFYFWEKPDPQSCDTIELTVKFDRVISIDTLKKDIMSLIDMRWKHYCERQGKPKTEKMKDFDKILEIGDLKTNNSEMTFKEIADQVFPYDESPESAEKKAQQRYGQYKELINGGWKSFKIF
jgi:hypothetical protein